MATDGHDDTDEVKESSSACIHGVLQVMQAFCAESLTRALPSDESGRSASERVYADLLAADTDAWGPLLVTALQSADTRSPEVRFLN